jgi:hypothetical protein
MVRNSGQAIGQAVAGAVVVSAIAPVVGSGGLDALRASVGANVEITPLLNAFLTGLQRAYLLAAILAACGAVISLLRGPRAVTAQAAQPEPAPGGVAQNAD